MAVTDAFNYKTTKSPFSIQTGAEEEHGEWSPAQGVNVLLPQAASFFHWPTSCPIFCHSGRDQSDFQHLRRAGSSCLDFRQESFLAVAIEATWHLLPSGTPPPQTTATPRASLGPEISHANEPGASRPPARDRRKLTGPLWDSERLCSSWGNGQLVSL